MIGTLGRPARAGHLKGGAAMSLSAAKRSFAEQHAFNREVLERLWQDPALREAVEKIETDRDGNLIMSPPRRRHAHRTNRIAKLLDRLLPEGVSLVDITVSTLEGLKVPDVAWYSRTRAQAADADPDEVLST